MMGHPRVIGYLQRAVNHEFSAAQQYTLQAVQAEQLGLKPFASELRVGVSEELRHAEEFISRMYRLGTTPRAGQMCEAQVGRTYAEMLEYGLATEAAAIRLYEEASRFCQQIGDTGNSELFLRILDDEVSHYEDLARQIASLSKS